MFKKIKAFIENPPNVFWVYFLRIWSQLFKLPNTVKKLRQEQLMTKELLLKYISELNEKTDYFDTKLSELNQKLSILNNQFSHSTSELSKETSKLTNIISNNNLKFYYELDKLKSKLENFINNTSMFLSDIHSLEFIRTPLNLLSEERKFLTSSYPYSIQTSLRTLQREVIAIKQQLEKLKSISLKDNSSIPLSLNDA